MNIVLTGSLGHISKPLAEILVQKGHTITIISSKAERQKDIEALGAKAAIGSVDDVAFLTKTFMGGADIVYLMEPPVSFFEKSFDIFAYYLNMAKNYVQAVLQSGVKNVIHLSSIGAHTDKGNGMLRLHFEIENILRELPSDVAVKFMRPVGFYYNLFAFINPIKTQGIMAGNYDGDEKQLWVSPLDIADVITEEMEKPFEGRIFRYITSDEVSMNEAAKILGEEIGKPELKWLEISDEQALNGLLSMGFNTQAAEGLTEMNAGRRGGKLYEDYYRNEPILGKVKLKDFAKEFTAVYKNS